MSVYLDSAITCSFSSLVYKQLFIKIPIFWLQPGALTLWICYAFSGGPIPSRYVSLRTENSIASASCSHLYISIRKNQRGILYRMTYLHALMLFALDKVSIKVTFRLIEHPIFIYTDTLLLLAQYSDTYWGLNLTISALLSCCKVFSNFSICLGKFLRPRVNIDSDVVIFSKEHRGKCAGICSKTNIYH